MCGALALVVVSARGFASPQPVPPPVALKQQLEGPTPLLNDLGELCDGIGGRITGTPAAARAVGWAVKKFEALGVDDVHTEPYPMPFLWAPGPVTLRLAAPEWPEPLSVDAIAVPNAAPTGAPLEGPLVDLGFGTAADFARVSPAKGSVALVHSKEMKSLDDLLAISTESATLVDQAKRFGLGAVVFQSNRPRGLVYQDPVVLGRTPSPLPVVMVGREVGERLARLVARGQLRAHLEVACRIDPAPPSQLNVVAEVKGRETPDEIVVLGAHLDSWALGSGAEDNGINVALVLDVARAFHALGLRPRRTVRFVLFTGEEQGQWGSAGYVQRHRDEIARHKAVIVFDVGSGRTKGFWLSGRDELRRPVARAVSLLPGLGEQTSSLDGVDGTDNFAFLLSGVATIVADQDERDYLVDYHASSDTPERVNVKQAKRNTTIAGLLTWGLANTPEPLPRQLTRPEVEAFLVKEQLVDSMKATDQWVDWCEGRLGAPLERPTRASDVK